MTNPLTRRYRERQAAIKADFPDTGETTTQILQRVPADKYDEFADILCPDCGNYICTCGDSTYQQPAVVAVKEYGRNTEPLARLRAQPRYAPAAAGELEDTGRLSQPSDRTPIGSDTARGWHAMFTVPCDYPAGNSGDQVIPCDQTHRDDRAGSFPALYRSAWNAGWRMDKLRRWACPRHAQDSGDYQALYPITHWHPDAAGHDQAGDPGTAFRLRVISENVMTRDVRDQARQGKHRARVA